jgi:phospholipid transport system substrate-binding protein
MAYPMITYSLFVLLSVELLSPRLAEGGTAPSRPAPRAQPRLAFSQAPSATSGPTAAVRTSSEALRKTLSRRYPSWSPQAEAQENAVEAVIDGIVDFTEIARRSLGPHWQRLSPEEQKEFVGLMQRIIERSPFDRTLHLDPESTIKYERESIADNEAMVSSVVTTVARHGGSTRHPVQYRLSLKAGRWRIYDIIVNDVSLVEGYHAQFTKIIAHDSFDGLLRRMRKKVGETAR